MVVINASDHPSATRANAHRMRLVSESGQPLLREGDRLEVVVIAGFATPEPARIEWRDGFPEAEVAIPPQTLAIFRVRH